MDFVEQLIEKEKTVSKEKTSNSNYLVNESTKIRTAVDSETGIKYYSVIDAIYIYREDTSFEEARNYWAIVKHRIKKKAESNKFLSYTRLNNSVSCIQVKVVAKDGKSRNTDFATKEHLTNILEYITYSKIIDCYGMFRTSSARLPNVQPSVYERDMKYISDFLDQFSCEERRNTRISA